MVESPIPQTEEEWQAMFDQFAAWNDLVGDDAPDNNDPSN